MKLIAFDLAQSSLKTGFATNLNVVRERTSLPLAAWRQGALKALNAMSFVVEPIWWRNVKLPAGKAVRLNYRARFNLGGKRLDTSITQYALVDDESRGRAHAYDVAEAGQGLPRDVRAQREELPLSLARRRRARRRCAEAAAREVRKPSTTSGSNCRPASCDDLLHCRRSRSLASDTDGPSSSLRARRGPTRCARALRGISSPCKRSG